MDVKYLLKNGELFYLAVSYVDARKAVTKILKKKFAKSTKDEAIEAIVRDFVMLLDDEDLNYLLDEELQYEFRDELPEEMEVIL